MFEFFDCFICWCTRASFVLLLLYFLFNVWYLKLKRPEKWFAGAILASEAPEVGFELNWIGKEIEVEKCAFIGFGLFQVLFLPFLLTNDFSRLWNCRIFGSGFAQGTRFRILGIGGFGLQQCTPVAMGRPAGVACLSGAGGRAKHNKIGFRCFPKTSGRPF